MNEVMHEVEGRVIRKELRTSASPEQVWRAFADPEVLAQWFVDRATGSAQPGETITWYFDGFGIEAPQQVMEAEPGKRLVMRSKWDAASTVPWQILDIRIAREGGETVLRLVHSGFAEGAAFEEEYDGVDSGWSIVLASLKHYLENWSGKPKSEVLAIRTAAFEYEDLRPLQRTGSGLSRWLTQKGVLGDVGSPVRLVLRSGRALTGRVLAMTRSECLWSWDEVNGVLELKSFGGGGTRMLGVRAALWNASPVLVAELQRELDEAVDRLVQAVTAQ
jgi:uncharacterized protein YndB with AHSA1/START domain